METGALGMHGLLAHQNAGLSDKETATTLFQNMVVRHVMGWDARKVLVLQAVVSMRFFVVFFRFFIVFCRFFHFLSFFCRFFVVLA